MTQELVNVIMKSTIAALAMIVLTILLAVIIEERHCEDIEEPDDPGDDAQSHSVEKVSKP